MKTTHGKLVGDDGWPLSDLLPVDVEVIEPADDRLGEWGGTTDIKVRRLPDRFMQDTAYSLVLENGESAHVVVTKADFDNVAGKWTVHFVGLGPPPASLRDARTAAR